MTAKNFGFLRIPSILRHKRNTGAVALLFLLLSSTVFLSGCAVTKPLPWKTPPPVKALPEIYAHYYDYPPGDTEGELIHEETHKSYILRQYEIPLRLPPELNHQDPEIMKKDVSEIEKTDKKKARDLK
ncbi:MAG TPA: hypothetical protein VD913_00520, partial [bacterium]|nr:hypothetical protein [bacterium]